MSRVAEEYVAGLVKKKTGADGKPLSNAELRVLKVLAFQHNELVWCAWPKLRALAEEVGMSQSHLRRTLAGLEQREMVKRYGAVSDRWGEATSNEYELVELGPAAVPQAVRDSVFKYKRTRLATQLSLRRGGRKKKGQVQSDQVDEVATAGDASEVQSDQVDKVATAGDASEVQSDQVDKVATAGDAVVVEMSVEMIAGGNHHGWGGQPPWLPVEFLKELEDEVLTPLTPLGDAQCGKTSNGKSKSAWTGQKPEAKATAKAKTKTPGKVLEFLQRDPRSLVGEEAALYDATEDVLHACGVASKTCPRRLRRAIAAALECAVVGGDCGSLDDAVQRAYSSWLEYRAAAACLIGPVGMRQFFLGGDWLDRKGWRWNMRAVEESGRVLPWMRRKY